MVANLHIYTQSAFGAVKVRKIQKYCIILLFYVLLSWWHFQEMIIRKKIEEIQIYSLAKTHQGE